MASRNYAAAAYFNQYGSLPSGRNWIAIKRVVMLPPLLDPKGRRNVEAESSRPGEASGPSESLLALEDMRRSRPRPMRPSPATSSVSPAPKPPRVAKPPPPIYPEGPAPSPAKSGGPSKGTQSYGKTSWDGDWKSRRESPWDWNTRTWRRKTLPRKKPPSRFVCHLYVFGYGVHAALLRILRIIFANRTTFCLLWIGDHAVLLGLPSFVPFIC